MIDMIQKRLAGYGVANGIEEENAIKEILQEIILFALWQVDFFDVAAFQGGTSLRILHQLPRFSEDMDFLLKEPDPTFSWQPFLDKIASTCEVFGVEPEVLERKQMDRAVRTAVIKDNSIANQLNLSFKRDHLKKKLQIKLEVDSNPPSGSGFGYTYLDFPVDFDVCHQDLSSNFALKLHALLCRPYLKGRDWYDFGWYVANGVVPNLLLLKNALDQHGPWQGEELQIDLNWLSIALKTKIESIRWHDAVADVKRFIRPIELKSLSLWSTEFFLNKANKLVKK